MARGSLHRWVISYSLYGERCTKKLYAPTKGLALRQLEHGAKVVNITEDKEYYVYEKRT